MKDKYQPCLMKHYSSLSLHLSLCLSVSVDVSLPPSAFLFQFLRCQSRHLPLLLTLKALSQQCRSEQVKALHCRIGVTLPCVKDSLELIHMHTLSWTHGVASLHAELCLSALVKGMRWHLNAYEVFLRSRGEQPLMVLSQMNLLTNAGPFWLTHVPDEPSVNAAYLDVMPEY